MVHSPFHFRLGGTQAESTFGFLVDRLIQSQEKLGRQGDPGSREDAIIVYLAHLLLAVVSPEYGERIRRYTSPRDSDVFRMVERSQDNAFKYLIYKTNADNLLVVLGLFDTPQATPTQEPAFYRKSRSAFEGYGQTYYEFASAYLRQMHRGRTAVTSVLERLGAHFGRYSHLLSTVRDDYFTVLKTSPELSGLWQNLQDVEAHLCLRDAQDAFLDAYSEWMAHRTDPRCRARVVDLARRVQALDPGFQFHLPD